MKENASAEIELLKAALEAQNKQNDRLAEQNQQLMFQMEKMQQQLDNLLRILYGKKSEKKKSSDDDKPDDKSDGKPPRDQANDKKPDTKKKPKRKSLPDDLLREKIEHTLSEEDRSCSYCSTICHHIGNEISEQLEFIPAKLYVKQHVRYKYACKFGCEVKIASMPEQAIAKCMAGPSVLAEVLINKYQDALPLYRQSLRFDRHGMRISESTLCDWVMHCSDRLQPIVFAMKADLLRQKKLHTDDTIIPVLAQGKSKQARLWVYVGDGSCGPKITVYDYTPTRAQAGPKTFLVGFKGFLQADAYAGYDILYQSGDIIEVGCLAHTRRKFFEIAQTVKHDSIAHDAIKRIGEIYKVEAKIRGYDYQKRHFYRKKYLKLIYQALHHWLIKKQKQTLDKTPIRQAINYALNHWRALQNVFADGRLLVDNNTAERAIKPVVIGRKNYLFAGSDVGGKRAAILYSIIETCKQNAINTFDYLRDVLTRLPTQAANKIHELLPYNWNSLTV